MDESLVLVPSDSKSFLRLLAFGGLAHDPQRILATVQRLAFVRFKLCLYVGCRHRGIIVPRHKGFVAVFADSHGGIKRGAQTATCA